MYYDSHTHLNDEKLYPNRKQYLENFVQQWGKWLVNVWANHLWNLLAIQISKAAQSFDCIVKSAIGYHPSEITDKNILQEDFLNAINELKNLYLQNKEFVVAIWEAWIDMHYPNSPSTESSQQDFFAMHCELAKELALPLVVHSRDWFDLTLDVLQNYKTLKIYFHCWWYWPDEIKKIDAHFDNYFIWFAGNVTYPKAISLKDSLKVLDLNRLVLETDAPYLSPQIQRWTTNEPIFVKHIYDYVWDYLALSPNMLQSQIEKNFKLLYNI